MTQIQVQEMIDGEITRTITLPYIPKVTREAEEDVEYYRNWLRNRNEWLLKEWGL